MPGKRSFEEQLAALDSLRQLPPEACTEPLRKALAQRNNFVVAKAAGLVREFHLAQLIPELLLAFDRFFENPIKTDPQCWAKNAISRALAGFEYQGTAVFLRGMRHIQLEPVWGGSSDTAGTLRATCALALVQCRSLVEADLLAHLVELMGDKDKAVRVEVVRAIEQVGSPSAALLLRLRAVLGSDEPEVLGACYSGILRIEGASAIPWITRFLASGDDPAAEAALAIAGTHSPQGRSHSPGCGPRIPARSGPHRIAAGRSRRRSHPPRHAVGRNQESSEKAGSWQPAPNPRIRDPPPTVFAKSPLAEGFC